VFLAIGGFFTAIMVGWFMDKKALKEELNNQGETPFKLFEGWYFLIKYVIPFAIGAVAITGIRSVEETGVVVLGMGIIALLAFISKKL
jgi:NSS family neurotransmitter:Na+ symporter